MSRVANRTSRLLAIFQYEHIYDIYLCIPKVHLILLKHLPADHASVIHNDIEVSPGMKLALPVCNGGEWGDDEEWPLNAHTLNLLEECDGLDCFSEAHLVCQNAVSSKRWRGRKNNNILDGFGVAKKERQEKEKQMYEKYIQYNKVMTVLPLYVCKSQTDQISRISF